MMSSTHPIPAASPPVNPVFILMSTNMEGNMAQEVDSAFAPLPKAMDSHILRWPLSQADISNDTCKCRVAARVMSAWATQLKLPEWLLKYVLEAKAGCQVPDTQVVHPLVAEVLTHLGDQLNPLINEWLDAALQNRATLCQDDLGDYPQC